MELDEDRRIGVVSLRKYAGKHDYRFEMESSYLGFSLFRNLSSSEEELDPELVREWWFRFKFWAHAINVIRFRWMAYVARMFL